MNRFILCSVVLFLLVIAGCSSAPDGIQGGQATAPLRSSPSQNAPPIISDVTVDAVVNSSNNSSNASFASPRIISVEASNWNFVPSTIPVRVGESVVLRVTSLDVDHGVGISSLGISQTVPAGETVDIPLAVNTSGNYSFRCNVMCGEGHRTMTGTLVVEE